MRNNLPPAKLLRTSSFGSHEFAGARRRVSVTGA